MEKPSKKAPPKVGVKIIKAADDMTMPSVFYADIKKSDKPEQLNRENATNASEWIGHPINMWGLKELVDNSTILPQCIKAYKSNIAGFGIAVKYNEDYPDESAEMKAEFAQLQEIISLLNMDMMTKEVFENVIRDRETYGIAYCEVIRDISGNVVQLDFIVDTPSIDMTYPIEPYVDISFYRKGKEISRKRKFRKYRQNVAGKTVYFKEFSDPRVMDKKTGKYGSGTEDEAIAIDDQANEIIEFRIGSEPYGEVRWIGQVLTVDGNRRAEMLNNNYFRKGRHTPLMIVVKGGSLSDASFEKLQSYMNGIQGEAGQHAFLLLETESNEPSTGFAADKAAEVEIKDMAGILQKDELFQDYLENGRKKTQSAFLLPDLYVGYTKDFNRATAQTTMEVTEEQVFQPERGSLAWIINNRLLNEYKFKYVEVYLKEPDITNPDDIQKILNITERAGGLTPNVAKDLTYKTLGRDVAEPYPEEWGDIPIQLTRAQNTGSVNRAEILEQLEAQIQKAAQKEESDIIPVLKEIRKALADYREEGV